MSKGPSEGLVRQALTDMHLDPYFVHKLADDARNWKPCDYMVWWYLGMPYSAWIEVKQCDQVSTFPFADIEPSQRRGVAAAERLRIPYLVAIRWKKGGMWSIVDGIKLMDWFATQKIRTGNAPTSIPRPFIESAIGVSCSPGQLSSMLRMALIEGF